MNNTPELNARILKLAERIKDNWTLCELFCGTGRASEKEMMVAQTIHASKNNLRDHGEAFSIRGDGVFTSAGNGIVDNATAYGYLIKEGFFLEEERDGKTVIIPTERLLSKLEGFLPAV